MRRLDPKRVATKIPALTAIKGYKKYSHTGEDVTDVLDTDEDRVMLYYSHINKNDATLLKRSQKEYHA